MGAAQGMFPMMNPNMWNVPMNQWQQFFGNQQFPPHGFNPMMLMPPGISPTLPQTNSQGSSASLVPSQQQQVSGNKNKKKIQKGATSDSQKNNGDKGGSLMQTPSSSGPGPVLDPKFKNVTCYNCGELGHYVGLCTRVKRCFICSKTGHHMDNCLMWYSLLPTAQYWGSANPGLGFFHVDVEGPEAVQWLNMDNVGIVVIKEGEISAEELEKSFNDMWKVNWFWQIRQVGPKKFLVRFPPSKRIKELVEYPSINLKKEGVVIYFENWEGETEPFEEFQEIWVRIFGIPPKWLTWKTICQVSTALGVLINIDWQVIFRSFYEEVRVKVAVRDKSKIPSNKLFEMEQCFFLINFLVESDGETIEVDGDDDEDPGQSNEGDKVEDDAELGDDFKALEKSNAGGDNSKMETDPSYSGGRSGPRPTSQMAMESSVQAKVFGKEPMIPTECALVIRSAEENIGKNLLQHFEEEEDDAGEGTKSAEEGELPKACVSSMLPNVWKEKKQWGPVQATRMSSRIPRDGKSAIEKAQDLKKAKNLEIPKVANQRRRKKKICQLKGEDGMVEDNKGMLKIAVDYYKNLFCKETCLDIDLVDDFWDPEDLVSQKHNDMLNAEFSEKEVKDAIFGSYAEGFMEELGLQLCTMANPPEGGRKRKIEDNIEQGGGCSSEAAAAVVAGAWLTPQKKARTTLEICDMNTTRGFGPMLITAEDLRRTLEANDLILVGDGAGFQVLNRP
ncbi:hypothetical protein QYE76_064321 [Lolium multiflorum]|uniref:CCHC-type domain-containing protein n=1 Tax=Lolium multiflorum TaxID=4521 RepID=A0AAD8W7I5_LOLMU|nr:hypothetical protein QYE76_064321 [Lolium multiflorum]